MSLPTQHVDQVTPDLFPPGQLHLIVWGPGHGEAQLLILPDGQLAVVDGCREADDPVAAFIAAMPAARIAFACLTHPHDDHYAGLGRLIERFRDRVDQVATINLMSVGRCQEALRRWVRTLASPDEPGASLVGGLERFIEQMPGRSDPTTRLTYLNAGQRVLREPVAVEACAPAGVDVREARDAVLGEQTGQRSTNAFNPNRVSAALTVQWAAAGLFLGGDLERGPKRATNRGWHALMEHLDPRTLKVIKAAHHGSHTGYHDPFWAAARPALTIVTPFKGATANQPPRREDLVRLAAHGPVALTAPPVWLTDAERVAADLGVSAPADEAILVVTPVPDDRHNAIAVSLDASGQVVQVVLAGNARFYDSSGAPLARPTTDAP